MMSIGDPAIPISAISLAAAWELAACDFGLDCGSEGKILGNLCAYEGQCGARTYEDWLSRHASSREELDQILLARSLLRRGLILRDWQLLGLAQLTPPTRDRPN